MKPEPLGTPEEEHRIYSPLFHDLDEYLPADQWHLKGGFNIDENDLRERLVRHLTRLKALA